MATIDKIDVAPIIQSMIEMWHSTRSTVGIVDRCISAQVQRETDEDDCRDHLIDAGILDKDADEDAATFYFEFECDQECELCDAYDGCPVVERHGP